MPATDQQVQSYADQQVRPICEAVVRLVVNMQSAKSLIDDVYAAVTEQNPTWHDNRTDGPPHLLVPTDITAFNAFITNMIQSMPADPNWPIIAKACVRNIQA